MEKNAPEQVKRVYSSFVDVFKQKARDSSAEIDISFVIEDLGLYVYDESNPNDKILIAENNNIKLFNWEPYQGAIATESMSLIEDLILYIKDQFYGSDMTAAQRNARMVNILNTMFSKDRM